MATEHDILQALDAFVRKYYKNLLVRGVLCSVGIVVGLYLAAVLLEHFGWLPRVARGLIFWVGLAAVVATLMCMVVRPLLKMYGHGRRIGRADAARIIGRHFPEVGDRLLNLLQLMDAEQSADSDLLLAAIEQKTSQLRPVPFLAAIDLRANRRYLKYAVPPLLVLVALLVAAPRTVTEPTRRIANYNTVYERPAPFAFRVLNRSLEAVYGADYELRVATEGEASPAEVWLVADGRRYRMAADGSQFRYTLHQLQRPVIFSLEGGGVASAEYRIEVLPDPSVVSFRMLLSYPAYTGREAEAIVNLGDAAVPEGTQVRWLFQTQDADSLCFLDMATGKGSTVAVDANGRAEMGRRVMHDLEYAFCVINSHTVSDTLRYSLSAIADAAPQIVVEEVVDSVYPDRRLFRGRVRDDYGFSKLVFRHRVTNGTDTATKAVSEAEIGLPAGVAEHEFYFSFNMAELVLAPGDRLVYWFEVSDNDGVHGPKTTASSQFELKVPTEAELDQQLARTSTEVHQSAQQQMGELRKMQEEIDEMMRRLVDKKELSWQDKKDLEQLHQKQQQVRDMMKQMQQQIKENNRLEQKYREQSDKILEKQRELDRLMSEVMDEKMKETMREIERMMQEVDKKKVQQELEQLKVDNAELEKQIDQNIELLKQLEIEKRVEQAIQRMDRLAEEQRALAQETEQAKGMEREQLQEKQGQLQEQFQELKSEVEDIRQAYKDLEQSVDFKVPSELEKQVDEHQQGAQKSLEKGKNKDAAQQQRQAAEDMEKLSEALAEAQLDAEQQNLAEDAEQIRQLLKNLVQLSFNQEELIGDLNAIYIQDPRYQSIIVRQNRVKDDFRNVEDSLRAMAKRQVQVASMISKEVGAVNSNISRSLSGLLDMNQSFYGNSKNTNAARSMQYSMTSLNNLAVVLAESLDKMQNQMRQNAQKKNSGQCKNTGKNQQQCNNPGQRPSPKSMRQMQQELNKQLEALKKQLDKQGKQQSQRHQIGQQQSMSEELAKAAAQQEMIRRMMQEYGQEMKQENAGNAKLAKEIDQMLKQMEQTETDLVNRTITQQTIKRQQQILTRLLEHEKAEMEREKEERRESHEAGDIYGQPSPAEMEKYQKQMQPKDDMLRSVPPQFVPYYRQKVSDYFYQ